VRVIDMSQPLFDGAPNCPAHPPVRSEIIADHPKVGWRVELLTMASHTGSHVDSPYHKLPDGPNLDQIPLERFTGQAVIVDLRDSKPHRPIDTALLSSRISVDIADKIVLLATGWGRKRAKTDEWLNQPDSLTEPVPKEPQGVRKRPVRYAFMNGIFYQQD